MNRAGTRSPQVFVAVRERPALPVLLLVALAVLVAALAAGTTTTGPRLADTGAVVSIGIIVVAAALVLSGGILAIIAFRRRKNTPAP